MAENITATNPPAGATEVPPNNADEVARLRAELAQRDALIGKFRENENKWEAEQRRLQRIAPIFDAQLEALKKGIDPEIVHDIRDLPVDRQYSVLEKLHKKLIPQVVATSTAAPLPAAPPVTVPAENNQPPTVIAPSVQPPPVPPSAPKPLETPMSSYEIELNQLKAQGPISIEKIRELGRKYKLSS